MNYNKYIFSGIFLISIFFSCSNDEQFPKIQNQKKINKNNEKDLCDSGEKNVKNNSKTNKNPNTDSKNENTIKNHDLSPIKDIIKLNNYKFTKIKFSNNNNPICSCGYEMQKKSGYTQAELRNGNAKNIVAGIIAIAQKHNTSPNQVQIKSLFKTCDKCNENIEEAEIHYTCSNKHPGLDICKKCVEKKLATSESNKYIDEIFCVHSYGFRGDSYLLDFIIHDAKKENLLDSIHSYESLSKWIKQKFYIYTKHNIDDKELPEYFSLKKFNHGGMSGGGISFKFWKKYINKTLKEKFDKFSKKI